MGAMPPCQCGHAAYQHSKGKDDCLMPKRRSPGKLCPCEKYEYKLPTSTYADMKPLLGSASEIPHYHPDPAVEGEFGITRETKCECGHAWYQHESTNGLDKIEAVCNAPLLTCYCSGFRKPPGFSRAGDGDVSSRPAVDLNDQTKGHTNMAETATIEEVASSLDGTITSNKKAPQYMLPDGREYVTRPFPGFDNDVEGLRWLVKSGTHVLLVGEPGCGKTALVQAAFPDAENELGHGRLTAFDMKYIPRPVILEDGTTSVVYDPAPLTRAAIGGKVLYFDEIMRTADDAFTPLFSAMDGRNMIIGGKEDGTDLDITPGFGVVAASNPLVRGAFLPDAIASRFGAILEVQTTRETLERLHIHDSLLTIWTNLTGQNEVWVPSVRDLLTAQKFLDLGKKQAAAYTLTGFRVPAKDRDVVAGVVGLAIGVRVSEAGGVIK